VFRINRRWKNMVWPWEKEYPENDTLGPKNN